jgi:hypothetical protein
MEHVMETLAAKRAKWWAYLQLSQRDDLLISETSPDNILYDYLVTITDDGKPTMRSFAVKAIPGAVPVTSYAYSEAAFPVILSRYNEAGRQGQYSWLQVPGAADVHSKSFSFEDEPSAQSSLPQMIKAIETWYDKKKKPEEPFYLNWDVLDEPALLINEPEVPYGKDALTSWMELLGTDDFESGLQLTQDAREKLAMLLSEAYPQGYQPQLYFEVKPKVDSFINQYVAGKK